MEPNAKHSLNDLYPKRFDIGLLIIASTVLLLIGYYLPILTVRKLWETNTFSILTGIVSLWKEKYFFLAGIIFFFSIIFPTVKLLSLSIIWFVRLTQKQRERMLRYLLLLGKWSMLDVFIVAVTIVTIKLGVLASARAHNGIYCFGLSILLAMVVTSLENNLAQRSKAKK